MISHQDKIKPRHIQLSRAQPAQEILTKFPPKYFTPKVFLSLQQKSLEISLQPLKKEFELKPFCNKYFGKKLLYVTDSRSLNRTVNCKLFQKAKLDKNIFSKEGFKAIGDLILIEKDTPVGLKQIPKVIRRCKGKVSIVLNQNIYRYTEEEMYQRRFQTNQKNPIMFNEKLRMQKWFRNFHVDLQSLSLTFQSVDQFPIFKGSLRNLRHSSLKFDQKFARNCGWKWGFPPLEYAFRNYQDQHFTFLLQIIKSSPHLQTLRLDLVPYSITPTPLAYLLLTLNYSEIPDWYVRIGTVSEDFMKIVNGVNIEEINMMAPVGLKSTSEVLRNVDFLGIYVVNYIEEISDQCALENNGEYGTFGMSVPRLGELPGVTCKYSRVLDVTLKDFSLEKCSVNLKKVLGRFSGLEGLYLKVVENVVIYEDNDANFQKKKLARKPRPEASIQEEKQHEKIIQDPKKDVFIDKFGWTRNLREAFITFLAVKGIGKYDFESTTRSFSKLMGALKTQCRSLTSLNVFRGHPVFNYNGQCVGYRRNPLIVPCDKITGIKGLTRLEITSDNSGLKGIGKTLKTLKNLEKFRINIVNNDHFDMYDENNVYEGGWERQRDFYELDEKEKILYHLPRLKELELVINQSEFSVKWTDHFVKYLPSLKSLEVLRVVDLNKDEIPLEVLMRIIDGLLRKRTLRRVEIDSVIVKNDAALELAAVLLSGSLSKRDVEDLAIKSLKGKIEQMVELNPKLELVDIHLFKGLKFERVLYDIQ